MKSRIQLVATVAVVCAVTGSMIGLASAQRARLTSVALGETSAPEPFGPALRDAMNSELARAPGLRVTQTARARYVIRGSVTRLDERRDRERAQIECEVSIIVADRRSGNVRFILEGRAAASGPRDERTRHSVVRAAVRGALGPLGQQL